MSKNNLRGITLGKGHVWGSHSLTLIISCLHPFSTPELFSFAHDERREKRSRAVKKAKNLGSRMGLHQAPVFRRLDNAIHRINCCPLDKCWQNKPRYPLDGDLCGGERYSSFEQSGPRRHQRGPFFPPCLHATCALRLTLT